jgi:hypothetical protein
VRLSILALVGVCAWTSSASAEVAWKELKSARCKSAILFPGTPQEQKQQVPSDAGTLDAYLYILETPGGDGAYLLMCSDYPKDLMDKATPDAVLDRARDGSAKEMEGKVGAEKKITVNGFPGREFEISTAQFTYTARLVLAKHRLHQAVFIVKSDKGKSPDTRKYLDSLKVEAP